MLVGTAFLGLAFSDNKGQPQTTLKSAKKPRKTSKNGVFPTHRFCGGGKNQG